MFKYEVTDGMVSISIKGVRYKGAKNHPTLPNILELPEKYEHPNLKLVEQEEEVMKRIPRKR